MKKITVFFILILRVVHCYSQSPYYDALELRKYIQAGQFDARPGDLDGYIRILRNYIANQSTLDDRAILATIRAGNPLLNNYIVSGGGSSGRNSGILTSVVSGTGGLNVTNVADGLAKFLVERTKQELSIAFFQDFKSAISANSDFKQLFPKTEAVLLVVDKEIYHYSSYLNTLKEAFDDDLKGILRQLEPFLKAKQAALVATDPVAAQKIDYFISALIIVNNIKSGVHPAKAIEQLKGQALTTGNTALANVQESIKLFSIFSNSITSRHPDKYWIGLDSLDLLLDPITFKIYLGLLYEKHGTETIFSRPFRDYLNEAATNVTKIEHYKDFLKGLVYNANNLDVAIKGIKEKKEAGEKIDSYADVFNSTLALIRHLDETKNLDPRFAIPALSGVTQIMDLVNDVYIDINERHYNALILDASGLLKNVLGTHFTWDEQLIRYGTFIANVAQAENSDQIQSAIEAIALPVGSASIKKNSTFNVSLNAYVGPSGGTEMNGDTQEWKGIFGLYTPVGVAFNWGKQKSCKSGKVKNVSNSIFFSGVDISAFSQLRFDDSKTEELPEVTLSNIFAPGLYYVRGFNKIPLSWGIGGQMGPQLRQITSSAVTLSNAPTFAIKTFLAVDIPIINFYTKSR
ncbi:MAG: hypothetical protein ACMVP2_26060 [Imperialibacter sp.]|uniref:hypothetical protein n=1 Tax=Imperialibacter sp. TaxID=2038411 RepID=UPI003A8AED4E